MKWKSGIVAAFPHLYKKEMDTALKKTLISIGLIIVMSPFVFSDTMVSLATEEGYSSNIFNDSFAISDSYTILRSDLLMYPTDMMEINFFGDYNKYSQTSGLSNLLGGVSVTLIPTNEMMKSQIFLNGSLSFVNYGTEFNYYNNTVVSGSGSWNYQFTENLNSRVGVGAKSVFYTNASSVSDNIYYVYGGLNTTIFSQNSIDIETAYYNKKFNTDDSFNSDNSYVDISVRYSRPISNALGMRMYYMKRFLDSADDSYMPGFTIDYLSPWSTLWGGDVVGFSFKQILPKQFVMTLSADYSDKSYIDQLESDLSEVPVYTITSRDDITKTFFIQFEKKYFQTTSLIIPRFTISYLDNNSSIDLYNFEKLTFHGSVSFNF